MQEQMHLCSCATFVKGSSCFSGALSTVPLQGLCSAFLPKGSRSTGANALKLLLLRSNEAQEAMRLRR